LQWRLAVVAGDPPDERKRPQQEEQMDQEIGLLGGEMTVEKLEAAVGREREGVWALGQVEQREEGESLPPPPPPQSPQAEETRPHQPLAVSSGGV